MESNYKVKMKGGRHKACYIYLAYFGAGFFLANGAPRFVSGISGKKF